MPKRGDNIRKRKDGRWEGRYKIGVLPSGQTQYRSVYGRTYSQVKEKMLFQKANINDKNTVRKELRFSELIKLWMTSNAIRFKGATKNKYQILIDNHIEPELGGYRLSQLNASLINEFLDKKLNQGRLDGKGGLSPSYVRTIRIIINAALKYGADEELCSPLRTQIHKPNEEKSSMTVLSNEYYELLERKLLSELDFTALGILISMHTGLRIGEVCALRWEDIDINERILTVRHTVARVTATPDENQKSKLIIDTPKTKTSMREIPINSFLLPILKQKKENTVSAFVVSNNSGFVSPRTFEYRFHKTLEKYNIKQINYHALRHTFATRCIERGVDNKSLSEILGHANVNITLNTYVHSSLELKRLQIEKLA